MRLYGIFALFKYVEMWIKIKILSAQAEKIMRIIIYGGSVNNFSEVFIMDFSFNLYNVAGTKLKERLAGLNCYIYGTLAKPITAHEVKYMNEFLRSTHPEAPIIAIDAAVGLAGDIGLIKLAKRGIKPGSGANKKLSKVGDVSIILIFFCRA